MKDLKDVQDYVGDLYTEYSKDKTASKIRGAKPLADCDREFQGMMKMVIKAEFGDKFRRAEPDDHHTLASAELEITEHEGQYYLQLVKN